MPERELCWRAASKRNGKQWLWLVEEAFNLEPAAYQYGQEQKHKEDRQRERNLVKTMTWVQCNGDRQHEYKSDSGYDHHHPGESTHPTLLLRHAHCQQFYSRILNYCSQAKSLIENNLCAQGRLVMKKHLSRSKMGSD